MILAYVKYKSLDLGKIFSPRSWALPTSNCLKVVGSWPPRLTNSLTSIEYNHNKIDECNQCNHQMQQMVEVNLHGSLVQQMDVAHNWPPRRPPEGASRTIRVSVASSPLLHRHYLAATSGCRRPAYGGTNLKGSDLASSAMLVTIFC
jgi:hypothetical protein